jgi:hypothetical protein
MTSASARATDPSQVGCKQLLREISRQSYAQSGLQPQIVNCPASGYASPFERRDEAALRRHFSRPTVFYPNGKAVVRYTLIECTGWVGSGLSLRSE